MSNIILKQTILLPIVMLIVECCFEAKQYCLSLLSLLLNIVLKKTILSQSLFSLLFIIVLKQTIFLVIVTHCSRANHIVDYIVDCYLCIVFQYCSLF